MIFIDMGSAYYTKPQLRHLAVLCHLVANLRTFGVKFSGLKLLLCKKNGFMYVVNDDE